MPEKFVLTVVSDGVLEFLPGKSYSEKQQFIADAVAKSDGSIEAICEGLCINQLADAPDDVTVLTVRRGY